MAVGAAVVAMMSAVIAITSGVAVVKEKQQHNTLY